MPRPQTKDKLIKRIYYDRAALEELLDSLTDAQKTAAGVVGDWSIKDVLAHLTAWEQMFLDWYAAGRRGETPPTPAEGFTWQQIPALNQQIFEAHHHDSVAQVVAAFDASHQEILSAIQEMSEEELFTPKVYRWTKSTTLGSYATSATCSHYDWARKEIKKGLKALSPAAVD